MVLSDLVKHYYSSAPLVLSDFPRREFAFQMWDQPGPNTRNRSFTSADTLQTALTILTPKAVYASNALYLDPANPDKNKKDLTHVKSATRALKAIGTAMTASKKAEDAHMRTALADGYRAIAAHFKAQGYKTPNIKLPRGRRPK